MRTSTADRATAGSGAKPPTGTTGSTGNEPDTTWRTLVRGVQLTPELRAGFGGTLLLALVATAGRVVVPVAVQQTIDRGLRAGAGPRIGVVAAMIAAAAVVVLITAAAAFVMNVRLYRASETALAGLRTRAFRHVHDLSMLHQQAERRGSLVSRVTSDVDQISNFVQFGGILIVVSLGQIVLASLLMFLYSWQLALLVYACFLPLALAIKRLQKRLAAAYSVVRQRVGDMLGGIAESVVGAQVIRAHAIEARTGERVDRAITANFRAQVRAQRISVLTFSAGDIVAGLANSCVVIAGVLLGIGGQLSAGELTAFLFLVTLFVQPVQIATEVLNEAQNAIAGWRRVLGVLDTPPDVADPGTAGRDLPPGPLAVRFEQVSFSYPEGPEVLHGIDLEVAPGARLAVVGETGSGKTTFAKLLTRLMDPTAGRVLISGVALTDVRFASLRQRVVMVPQDGFLFDSTVGANARYGRAGASDDDVRLAFVELGLLDWVDGLPAGLDTPVGERGESLSVGERQLVAVARAYLADPDLLVLDEATSAVDPATEVRLQRALDSLTRGRTTLAIAHRMSTAEAADEVIVIDEGRVVQRGPHHQLVAVRGNYATLHASWLSQARSA